MSRINTNVSSTIAQNVLSRSNNELQTALNRLSTGLRINDGKDDPAGLIASELLRRDITGVNKAISNSERANQLIATADSALGQVSSLLNDIRGLVSEAANSGALSSEQIAANQLQVDSSLEAIDRIAQVTTFQGERVLDGSLGFHFSGVSNFDRITILNIDQANFGSASSVNVAVEVKSAATQAQVDLTGVPASTSSVNAFGDLSLTNNESQALGAITDGGGAGQFTTVGAQLNINALNNGAAQDASGNNIQVVISDVVGATTANYTAGTPGVINVSANLSGGAVTDTDIANAIAAINGSSAFGASGTGTTLAAADAGTYSNVTSGGRDAGSGSIRVTADAAGGAANGTTINLIESTTIANNSAVASINGSGNIEVSVRGTVSYASIASAVDGLSGYSAALHSISGDQNYIDTQDQPPGVTPQLGAGQANGGGLAQSVVFELAGINGVEVFSFDDGTNISQIESAVNALSDATGVSASINGTTLELRSTAFGSDAFVDLNVISEAAGGTITAAVGQGTRGTGTDIVGTLNGIEATGNGNRLAINTSTLDLNLAVEDGFTGTSEFSINGGGAIFQLGPSIVSNQQARLGINSVNTASLGGQSGRLYTLRSGEANSLATDPTSAARIVDEVITKVSELRGRLGAFQRTTLESNIASLTETLSNLTDAESSIRDADFALESARLTRAQILVQSGTSVLSIANQNPQNVLALLR